MHDPAMPEAPSKRQQPRKGPAFPRPTKTSAAVGVVGVCLIAFMQWLRWMGGRGDPVHWAEHREDLSPLALPSDAPCANRDGFAVPLCANATADGPVAYLYPLVNAPYMGAFRVPATTRLDVVLSDDIPEQSIVVRAHVRALPLLPPRPFAGPHRSTSLALSSNNFWRVLRS